MTIEMTTTARGTQTPRLRGANIDRISAATKRSVWGTWTPAAEIEEAQTHMDNLEREAEETDLLDLVPVATIEHPSQVPGVFRTDRQADYISKLATERGLEVNTDTMTKREASAEIERLLSLPRVARPAAPALGLEDGVYVKDGSVFMVKHAIHGSGQQYASKLQAAGAIGEAGTWTYVGKAPLATLTAADRLTREMAQAYGEVYGCCVRCGRALTDPESIARSVGSTCWGKF